VQDLQIEGKLASREEAVDLILEKYGSQRGKETHDETGSAPETGDTESE
jgi:hypothetical protein